MRGRKKRRGRAKRRERSEKREWEKKRKRERREKREWEKERRERSRRRNKRQEKKINERRQKRWDKKRRKKGKNLENTYLSRISLHVLCMFVGSAHKSIVDSMPLLPALSYTRTFFRRWKSNVFVVPFVVRLRSHSASLHTSLSTNERDISKKERFCF